MRRTYIDNIRWITVVIVVIYHVIYMFNGVTTYPVFGPFCEFQPQDAFLYVVYPWFMLLLFVVSGMSARFELEKNTDTRMFIRKRTRKLLVPSTIGLLVFGWILGCYNLKISGAFESMSSVPAPFFYLILAISGCGPLWYIQMLWFFSVVLVWVRKIEKDKLYDLCEKSGVTVSIALVMVVWGGAQILNTPVITVYRFGIYGVGFLIGYFVFSHDKVMERLEQKWILLTAMALVSCGLYVVMYWGKSYPDQENLSTFVCNMFAWLGTMGVLAFMKKWGEGENSFTKWMNKESWGLYVFHYLAIAACAWYLRLYVPDMEPVLVYITVAVTGFAGAFAINFVVSRIPVLRWCVLGIKKNRKNDT